MTISKGLVTKHGEGGGLQNGRCGGGDVRFYPGGATPYQVCPDECVQKGWTWILFGLQVSEMSESVSTQYGSFSSQATQNGDSLN